LLKKIFLFSHAEKRIFFAKPCLSARLVQVRVLNKKPSEAAAGGE
jgi:hypothetical protein